jgi:head-tail adaptor
MLDLGRLNVLMTLEDTSGRTPDGNGGYTKTPVALSPPNAWASIEPVSQRALERLVSNTVITQATHLVRMRYHPDVNAKTRLTWTDREGRTHRANVTWVQDPDNGGTELTILCAETT